jgi:hypothetical protein
MQEGEETVPRRKESGRSRSSATSAERERSAPRGERERGGVMVEGGGAEAERGAGEVVLDETVDADGSGGVAELDAGEEDGEGGGDGGHHLAGGRHPSSFF